MRTSVYVASSWRCSRQPEVIRALRAAGVEAYDFRNPPSRAGFAWEKVMPSYVAGSERVEVDEYLKAIEQPMALAGFASDFEAMQAATHGLLVLPCNRSAHLELGWFVGQGRPAAILLDGPAVVPELMYRMVDLVTPSLSAAVDWATGNRASSDGSIPAGGAHRSAESVQGLLV